MSNVFTEERTKEYYDSFSDVYGAVWDEQVHTGFFDKQKTLKEAIRDMNIFLAHEAQIERGLRVLTVGCGRGGADRFLTRERNVKVIGLDLSKRQLEEAKKKAQAEGLENYISYIQGSMTKIPLEDNYVNYIWLQESFFHCHNKQQAVQEFNRVLNVQGFIIMEDTVLLNGAAREEVMERFGSRVRINEILTPPEHEQLFRSMGFKLEKSYDISLHLLKTYEAILEYISKNRELIRSKISPEYSEFLDKDFGFPNSLDLVKSGKLGCYVMVFRKINKS